MLNRNFCVIFIFSFNAIFFSQDSIKYLRNIYDLEINDSLYRIKLIDKLVDIDGNIYNTQKMGNQIWMIENLRTKHFNDGKAISLVQDSSKWIQLLEPGYCNAIGVLNYFSDKKGSYTKEVNLNELFYNQYVVISDNNICPIGWHVPVSNEWIELEKQVQKIDSAFSGLSGEKWVEGLTKNGLGFSEFPFGYRISSTGKFHDYYDFGHWWSSDIGIAAEAWARNIGFDGIHLDNGNYSQATGMSIKCIKNADLLADSSFIKIKSIFNDYIKFNESTDSEQNKVEMITSFQNLKLVLTPSELDLLLDVWMYYDPTDFPTRKLVYEVLKIYPKESIAAVKNRIKNKRKWEDEKSAPFSELQFLLSQLENILK